MKNCRAFLLVILPLLILTGCANSVRGSASAITSRTESFAPNGTSLTEVQKELNARYPKLSGMRVEAQEPPLKIKALGIEVSYIMSANLGSYRGGPLLIHTDVVSIFYFDASQKLVGRKVHVFHDFL